MQIGINCVTFTARGVYPTADGIDEAREMAKRIGAASIVGIGGGGTVDTAKATARLHASRYEGGLFFSQGLITALVACNYGVIGIVVRVRHKNHPMMSLPSAPARVPLEITRVVCTIVHQKYS